MSTRAIRDVIQRLEEATGEAQPDALAEVAAIDRAAKDLMHGRQFRGSAETIATLASIAKDAP